MKSVLIICRTSNIASEVERVCLESACDQCINVEIMNCRQSSRAVRNFIAGNDLSGYNVVIGISTKAMPLLTIIDTWVQHFERKVRVIGVAFGEPNSKALSTAQILIWRVPGQSDIIDETGNVYSNAVGLVKLLGRVIQDDLPPMEPRKEKSARAGCWLGG